MAPRLGHRLRIFGAKFLPPVLADLLRPFAGDRHLPQAWHQVESGVLKGTWLYLSPSRMGRMLRGSYEAGLVSAITSIVQPGWICLDVGAHFGYHSLLLAALVGARGQVHAFEPAPFNVRMLTLHVERNQQHGVVHVHPIALSDANGTAILRASNSPESSGLGFLAGAHVLSRPIMRQFTTLEVEQRRLDDLVAAGTIPRPHFLKIDVEGAEVACLRGAMTTLRTARPVVAAELHTAASAAESAGLLTDLGYHLSVLEDREAARCLVLARPSSIPPQAPSNLRGERKPDLGI